MLTVTDKASEVIKDFLKDKKADASIRVFLNNGCSGPSLGMALDETRNETDEVIQTSGTKLGRHAGQIASRLNRSPYQKIT